MAQSGADKVRDSRKLSESPDARSIQAADQARIGTPLLRNFVLLSLFLNLVHDLPGRVERMLGPVMLADGPWRGSLLRGDWDCGRSSLLMTLLHKKNAAESGREE